MPADAPPAIVIMAPAVPSDFRLEDLRWRTSFTAPRAEVACPESRDGEVVICVHRKPASAYRVTVWLPPPPAAMDEFNAALVKHVGPLDIGLSGIRLHF